MPPHEVFTACDFSGFGAVNDGALYCGNEISEKAPYMDKCAGYADKYGSYRYLVAPACLLNQLSELKAASRSAANTVSTTGETLVYNRSIIPADSGATTTSPVHRLGGPWMASNLWPHWHCRHPHDSLWRAGEHMLKSAWIYATVTKV